MSKNRENSYHDEEFENVKDINIKMLNPSQRSSNESGINCVDKIQTCLKLAVKCEFMEFYNFKNQLQRPFVVNADFECS